MKNKPSLRESLNLSGKLALTFIHSKLTLLIIISSLVFGLLALKLTPRTYNPEIIVPVVNISVSRPGSDAQEMLHLIVKPLEALMGSIPGVDHTYGMAINDKAIVTVRFKVNENEEISLVKIYNQINSNIQLMPSGTLPPLIQSVSLYDVPLLTLTLSSKQYNTGFLREEALKLLEELRNVPQVGKSWVVGASATAARVWLDPSKMAAHFIPLEAIQQALISNNVSLNAGTIDTSSLQTPIRVRAELVNPADLGRIIVGTFNGKPVFLSDIADIQMAPADEDIRSYIAKGRAGETKTSSLDSELTPAVTLAIARQKGSNGVDVANRVLERLQLMTQSERFPKDLNVTVTRNYGMDANDAVNTLIEHLGIAIGSIVLILLLFLGWREASVVVFSIPLILCIVLGVGWIAGQTINRITLFALILSLGLLVDDSIVVIENIHRHMLISIRHNFGRLVVLAANEIGKPTIIATFTVMLALIPMAFVSGMMGPFMSPIPFNAPLAMFVSLIIAYTVVPYLAYRVLKRKARRIMHAPENEKEQSEHAHHGSLLHRVYTFLFGTLMRSSWIRHIFYLLVLGLLFFVLLQPLWQFIRPAGPNGPLSAVGVALKMLPDDNVNTFLIEINAGAGSTLQDTRLISQQIAKELDENRFITDYQLFLGNAAPEDFAAMVRGDGLQQGPHFAQIRVNLIDKKERTIGSHQIAKEVYDSLTAVRNTFPKAHIKLFETPPGPPVRSQMEAGLYGPDYNQLQSMAEFISRDIYPNVYGMINIDNSVTEDLQLYSINVNRNLAIWSGLAPMFVAREIQGLFQGINIGTIHQYGKLEPENIILRLPRLTRASIIALNKLLLLNKQNQLVPLAKVVAFKEYVQQKPVYTRDQHQVVYVTGEMLQSSPAYGVATVTHKINNSLLSSQSGLTVGNLGFIEAQPNDITENQLFWLGEMRLTLDVFRDLGSAFIVAIFLIYILLTGFYRSFFIPLIIMGSIPLTIIGVFPGHWLMGQPFTATSMIGVIALAGIVVRNSLLLIDFIIERQRLGHPVESAVMESGRVRLLPILLTALAIIFGSSVMLSDPVFGGLAISLIFGALASTLLTLFLIPLIYLSWWKRRNS